MGKTYYEILGISKDATMAEIKNAIASNASSLKYKEFYEAAITLTDIEKKIEYDKKLNQLTNNYEPPEISTVNDSKGIPDDLGERIHTTTQELTEEREQEQPEENINPEPTEEQPEENTNQAPAEEQPEENTNQAPTEEQPEENINPEPAEEQPEENTNQAPAEEQPEENTNQESVVRANGLANVDVKAKAIKIAATILAGPLGYIISRKILENKSLKLYKNFNPGKIKSISTEEAELIKGYNKTLEKRIDNINTEKHSSYKNEILIARYEEQVELLRKRIEIRENTTEIKQVDNSSIKPIAAIKNKFYAVKDPLVKLKRKFELISLKNELVRSEKKVEKYTSKNIENNEANPRLARLNEEIIKKSNELNRANSSNAEQNRASKNSIKNLEIYVNKTIRRRNTKASINKAINYGNFRDRVYVATNFVISVKDLVTSTDPLTKTR